MEDATSFYRGLGPLTHLKKHHDIEFRLDAKWNWATVAADDAVFMQRPYSSNHVEMIEMAKLQRKKVWVDYDDDLFNVPTDNPAYNLYGKKDIQSNVAKCLVLADQVTVSTKQLKNMLANPGRVPEEKITVIPNALATHILPPRTPNKLKSRFALWRGTDTHQRDLMSHCRELIDLVNNKSDKWTWHFLGYNPWFVTGSVKEDKTCFFSQQLDLMEYHKFLQTTNPALMFVPLHANVFNLSKSNIAWLEAVYAGAMCVGPDWEEWKDKPSMFCYSNPKDFHSLMADLIKGLSTEKGSMEFARQAEIAWEYVQDTLTLDKVNEKRWEVIQCLLN